MNQGELWPAEYIDEIKKRYDDNKPLYKEEVEKLMEEEENFS
jgi:hypothetical protein